MQITPLQINIAGISLQTNQPTLMMMMVYEQYTINSMEYLIGLDEVDPVDRRYIGLETRLQGKQAIDQRRTVYQE